MKDIYQKKDDNFSNMKNNYNSNSNSNFNLGSFNSGPISYLGNSEKNKKNEDPFSNLISFK